jgi:hypothetical protein
MKNKRLIAMRNRNKLFWSGLVRQDKSALFELHRIFLQTQDASG